MERSNFLPTFASQDAILGFLRANSKETFVDERKHYFNEEEINDLARNSSISGGEILALEEILDTVKQAISKGNEEAFSIEIPQTSGTKALAETRRGNDLSVRKGYETNSQMVYGLVDEDRETMRYFNELGEEVVERERALSTKEKREFLGMFMGIAKTGTND